MAQPMGAKLTTNHVRIKEWVEGRGGRPEERKSVDVKPEQLLTITFGKKGEKEYRIVSWKEFFEKFDEEELAFLFQDETADGEKSNFFKLICR